mmetsp:Transcript_1959/g.6273  ORF Transcript_1959/g.6273 Transcript_1959/m.6273 type:complete len:400 (-) Transcript_1959:239-1438(-)
MAALSHAVGPAVSQAAGTCQCLSCRSRRPAPSTAATTTAGHGRGVGRRPSASLQHPVRVDVEHRLALGQRQLPRAALHDRPHVAHGGERQRHLGARGLLLAHLQHDVHHLGHHRLPHLAARRRLRRHARRGLQLRQPHLAIGVHHEIRAQQRERVVRRHVLVHHLRARRLERRRQRPLHLAHDRAVRVRVLREGRNEDLGQLRHGESQPLGVDRLDAALPGELGLRRGARAGARVPRQPRLLHLGVRHVRADVLEAALVEVERRGGRTHRAVAEEDEHRVDGRDEPVHTQVELAAVRQRQQVGEVPLHEQLVGAAGLDLLDERPHVGHRRRELDALARVEVRLLDNPRELQLAAHDAGAQRVDAGVARRGVRQDVRLRQEGDVGLGPRALQLHQRVVHV